MIKDAQPVDSAAAQTPIATQKKDYLYSLIGKIVVYDIKNGEIVHEVPQSLV